MQLKAITIAITGDTLPDPRRSPSAPQRRQAGRADRDLCFPP